MKNSVIVTTIAMFLGAAVFAADKHDHGSHDHQKPAHKHPATKPTTGPTTKAAKPVNQYCPIMEDEKIDAKLTTVYKGKTVGFCCDDCIEPFQKNPEKYMKSLK